MRDERVQSLRTIVELVQSRAQALDERVKAGTLTKDAALSELAESTMTMRYSGGTNYIAIYTMDGVALAAMNRKDIGKNQMDLVVNGVPIIRAFIERLRASDSAMLEYEYLRPGREGVFPKVSVATRFAPWDIFIVTGAYIDDIAAAFRSLAFTVLALLVGIVGVSVLGSLLIGRSITRPLGRLHRRMRTLAEGDITSPVSDTERGDEIGRMAEAVEVFRQAMVAKGEMDVAAARDAEAKIERAQALDALTRQFEGNAGTLMQGLTSAATEMQASAATMAQSAARTSTRSAQVAEAAQETSASVQTVAAATEEMSTTIREISGQMARSSAMIGQAATEAQRTDAIVRDLAEGAEKIGAVASMIAAIASQTNLLALNATIEAARAGEAGRGFAVVASEVKELAGQTAQATAEIATRVGAVQASTRQAVEAIQEIGRTVTEVNTLATSVAAAIEEQEATTGEIVRSVAQAADGTSTVTGNIADVSTAAQESGKAAEQVLAAASELAQKSGRLSAEITHFLDRVRAA
ncbi:methyl-accepting chemotaxis protein [Methylobacterium sp. GXF4]|uniref:methyl-accepting chemotaxis protein n=1 Tax=Methylobacterium sp. GXF4 TaxID=1096546 RepID=UPI00030D1028|nr:methyl-accepting chemotaxis protein [Methylobacterium sp. GXF4]